MYSVLDTALCNGYRLIDTASVYKNELDIGHALQELLPKHSLNREDIFITSKLGPAEHGKKAYQACCHSLDRLGVPYLDLYLIHWPGVQKLKHDDPQNKQLRKQSWLAMEQLYKDGKVKAVGVSNYTISLLEELLDYATIQPAVLQVEFHPLLYQHEVQLLCQSRKIHMQAYSSLGCGKLLSHPLIVSVATEHRKAPSQILLKWALQHQASP
jgi:diketogulonate reductase-like aldo/keto reductase